MTTTIITKEIDGHRVVTGFSRPAIDPAATKAGVENLITETTEHQAYQTIKAGADIAVIEARSAVERKKNELLDKHRTDELETLLKETVEYKAYEIIKETVDLKKDEDVHALAEAWKPVAAKKVELLISSGSRVAVLLPDTDEYKDYLIIKAAKDAEIRQAQSVVFGKKRAIIEDNAVYFTPKAGEEIITEEEAAPLRTKLANLPADKALTFDGLEIFDYRGEVYWTQDGEGIWESHKIEMIGEDSAGVGAVFDKYLSEVERAEITEQAETARRDALSAEEKQTEFDNRKNALLTEAVWMKEKLIIEGVEAAEALAQSQTWYNEKLADLQALYGIEE